MEARYERIKIRESNDLATLVVDSGSIDENCHPSISGFSFRGEIMMRGETVAKIEEGTYFHPCRVRDSSRPSGYRFEPSNFALCVPYELGRLREKPRKIELEKYGFGCDYITEDAIGIILNLYNKMKKLQRRGELPKSNQGKGHIDLVIKRIECGGNETYGIICEETAKLSYRGKVPPEVSSFNRKFARPYITHELITVMPLIRSIGRLLPKLGGKPVYMKVQKIDSQGFDNPTHDMIHNMLALYNQLLIEATDEGKKKGIKISRLEQD